MISHSEDDKKACRTFHPVITEANMKPEILNRTVVTEHEVELFAISALALYFEILLIRWLPGTIQVLAYFTNVILLAAFFGLGLGCQFPKARDKSILLVPVVLLALAAFSVRFSELPVAVNVETEH